VLAWLLALEFALVLMRKKFLILAGKWLLEESLCFLDIRVRPEKFRFSAGAADEVKNCVMVVSTSGRSSCSCGVRG
jgi:hypothetical protein